VVLANPRGPSNDLIGQTVGSYTIMSELGEGGMGKVYLARHTLIGRKAAVKILNPESASDQEAVSRFFTEARLVNDIRHPNIVEVTDFGQFGELYCIVMEHLEGETLAARIDRVGAMAEADAVRIAMQVTAALGAAHDLGMVHRDLKPENIFLRNHPDYPDFVKVLDFGIAKLLGDKSPLGHHTKTGSVIGTPAYMSPEQCLGEATLDLRSDIYSLGVVLYELLTGRPPFEGDSLGRLIVCHVSEEPMAPAKLNPHVSPIINAVVLRALSKRPRDRFASMKDFREALELTPAHQPSGRVSAGRLRSISRPIPIDAGAGYAPPASMSAAASSAPSRQPSPWSPPLPADTHQPTAQSRPAQVSASPAAASAVDETPTVDIPVNAEPQDLVGRLAGLVLERLATGRLELPALPSATERSIEMLRQANPAFGAVAKIIGESATLRSRMIRLANSAAFPSLMPATTVDAAVTRIGMEGLYGALLEFAAREVLESRQPRVRDTFRRIWAQAMGIGLIARNVCELLDRESEATFGYLAGLMHSVGKPVVGALLIDIEQQMFRAGNRTPIGDVVWLAAVEASQRPVGAAIARKWKLAHPVAEAIDLCGSYDPLEPRALRNILRFSAALAQRLGLTVGISNPTHAGETLAEGRNLMSIDDRTMRVLSYGLKERAIVLSGIRGQ
jgi:serine/threonine protein kinase/HD-like signal output (HDOD) protein